MCEYNKVKSLAAMKPWYETSVLLHLKLFRALNQKVVDQQYVKVSLYVNGFYLNPPARTW